MVIPLRKRREPAVADQITALFFASDVGEGGLDSLSKGVIGSRFSLTGLGQSPRELVAKHVPWQDPSSGILHPRGESFGFGLDA